MKKLLYFLVPLCALSTFCRAEKKESSEEAPKLEVSGSVTFTTDVAPPNPNYYQGGKTSANQPSQTTGVDLSATTKESRDTGNIRMSAGPADILFYVSGKLENEWKYGAKLDLYAMRGETGIDKMYLIFERNNFGTVFVGNVKGPEDTFLCGGQQLLGGTTGVDGAVPNDLHYAAGIVEPIYMIGCSGKSTKFVYYSPKIYGFQAGFAVTPDTKHRGREAKDWQPATDHAPGNDGGLYVHKKGDSKPSGRNNMVFGLTHNHEINSDWSTQVAALYLIENTQPVNISDYFSGTIANPPKGSGGSIKLRNARAWQLTGTVTYRDWSLGSGYLNNGKSRLPVDATYVSTTTPVTPGGFLANKGGNAGQAWNAGLQYMYEKWAFAGVYTNTSRKVTNSYTNAAGGTNGAEKSTGNIYSFTTDYTVCSGLKVFAEVDLVSTKASNYACAITNLAKYTTSPTSLDAIKKQNSAVFVLGVNITF